MQFRIHHFFIRAVGDNATPMSFVDNLVHLETGAWISSECCYFATGQGMTIDAVALHYIVDWNNIWVVISYASQATDLTFTKNIPGIFTAHMANHRIVPTSD